MADAARRTQDLYRHLGADEVQAEHIQKPQLSYARDVAGRFFRNRVAVVSVVVLALLVAIDRKSVV